jgi:hypothetical protein
MSPIATFQRFSGLCIVLSAVLALSACGSIVDDAKTEKELKAEIPRMTEADMKVESVKCPDDQDFTKGATFECDYTVKDGSEGAARVTVTSAEGDGELEYSLIRYANGQMEQFLLENTEGNVTLASVTCPETIEDGTVCTFEDEEGDTGKISLAFDAEGNFESTPTFD